MQGKMKEIMVLELEINEALRLFEIVQKPLDGESVENKDFREAISDVLRQRVYKYT